ncbi:silent information regulator family protein, partial [Reticulomyxa filosa]
ARVVARLIASSKHVVVYTGAGISTAAQIPDYRGPQGVWTLKAKGIQPKFGVELDQALPTFSHRALAHFVHKQIIHHIVSTNVDGLHLRSGLPHKNLSELHGNIYLEYWCVFIIFFTKCGTEYLRPFDITKLRHKKGIRGRFTGRLCEDSSCNGKLRDSIINFGEDLPENELKTSLKESQTADLVIVIGSSMRVSPACNMPSLSYNKHGVFVLINLQKTRFDEASHVRVFSKCDEFMKMVCDEMNIEIPEFSEEDMAEQVEKDCKKIVVDSDF